MCAVRVGEDFGACSHSHINAHTHTHTHDLAGKTRLSHIQLVHSPQPNWEAKWPGLFPTAFVSRTWHFPISLAGSLRALQAQGHAGGGGRRGTSQDSLHLDATHHRLQKPAFSASGRLLAPERLWHRCVRAPLTWSRAPLTRAAPPRWCQKCDQSDKLMGRAGGKGPNSSCRPCIGYSLMSLPRPDLFGKALHTLPRVRTKGEKKKEYKSLLPSFFLSLFSLFFLP